MHSQPFAPPGSVPESVPATGSQPLAQRQPYSPFRAPAPAAAAPPATKKSRKGPVIAIGVFGLVVAGAVAFAIVRDSKPDRSRDHVIKKTFAALASGDENALFELADPAGAFTLISRCEKPRVEDDKDKDDPLASDYRRILAKEQAVYREPKKMEEQWRKDLRQLLRRTKGAKLQVVDILTEAPPAMGAKPDKSKSHDRDDDDRDRKPSFRDYDEKRPSFRDEDEDRPEYDKDYKTTTYRKGDRLVQGCYAKTPFRRQLVKVAVDIKDGDREFTQRVKLNLMEINGNWYLSSPPSLNVGFDVVVQDLQDWRDKTCKCTGAGCVEDLDTEYGRLGFVQYEFDKDADLPREMLPKIEKLQQERKVCEGTARGGPELARYKAMKDALCACTDEECGRKIELDMFSVRRQLETNARGSYELSHQISDLAVAAAECTRKLTLLKASIDSVYPSSGEMKGGTMVWIRGARFTTPARTAKVFFGTKEATNVRIVNDYEIIVEAPPADVEGFVTVKVQLDPGGLVYTPMGFTYLKPSKATKKPKLTTPL